MIKSAQRTVADLPHAEFEGHLRGNGLGLRVGPFDLCVRVSSSGLSGQLQAAYWHYPVLDHDRVFSAHVELHDVRRLRLRAGKQVRFLVDGRAPHADMPATQALAVLEWGINLVIALRFQCFLMLHAAALERGGRAILLPAAPGCGKTTLCAALAHRGWRLFSDEFGLVRPGSVDLLPVPRAMPLKNESIAVIREFAPDAYIGPQIVGTRKGTVAHVRPTESSVRRAAESAPARWIVFPRWVAGTSTALAEVPRAEGFMRLAMNAFNYEKLGEAGFDTARALVDGSRCYRLEYSDLAEAVAALTRLADDDAT